jgi:hypothetical protein
LTDIDWMPFQAEHEDAQPADHRHDDVLEDVRFHCSPHHEHRVDLAARDSARSRVACTRRDDPINFGANASLFV